MCGRLMGQMAILRLPLITLDVEATCFEGCGSLDREIIEIGACYLGHAGVMESEFQTLVKPRFNTISPFCEALTSISSTMVKGAPEFPAAINQFGTWINSLEAAPVCWGSWGLYDLNQLNQDSVRWQLGVLPLPTTHINLKSVYQKRRLKGHRQVGLGKAMELEGLRFDGPRHRALADARAVALILEKLIGID